MASTKQPHQACPIGCLQLTDTFVNGHGCACATLLVEALVRIGHVRSWQTPTCAAVGDGAEPAREPLTLSLAAVRWRDGQLAFDWLHKRGPPARSVSDTALKSAAAACKVSCLQKSALRRSTMPCRALAECSRKPSTRKHAPKNKSASTRKRCCSRHNHLDPRGMRAGPSAMMDTRNLTGPDIYLRA
jgi:hypothetical protein